MNYFLNNTLTHYTTKLPKIMDLDGTWEIGLAEIQYPHSWYNVKNKEAWLKVHFYKESELQKHLVLLPDGYYSSAKRIIKAIDGKKHRMELKNKFHMFFSEINHKIDMKVKTDCYQSFITIHVRIQTSYIPGGGVCFGLSSGCQERIKFSVRVLSLRGIENGGRCPSTVIENRTGGRKKRRNDHPSV